MLITAGERKATALLCMALHDIGVPADSLHGQPGRLPHRHATTRTPRSSRSGADRRARGAVEQGRVPVVGGSQGVSRTTATSRSSAAAAPTPRRWRWPTRSRPTPASSTPTCPGCSPPTPAWSPDARRMSRISFDEMLEMCACGLPEAGHARGRVRPHVGRRAARPFELHLGAGHLGHRGGSRPWSRPSSRRRARRPPRPRSPSAGVPDQPGIAAQLFRRPGRPRRERRHDRAEHRRSCGITDISFTRPPRRPRHGDRGVARPWPAEIGATGVTADAGDRQGEPRRRRHEVQPRRGRHACSRRWPTAASTSR